MQTQLLPFKKLLKRSLLAAWLHCCARPFENICILKQYHLNFKLIKPILSKENNDSKYLTFKFLSKTSRTAKRFFSPLGGLLLYLEMEYLQSFLRICHFQSSILISRTLNWCPKQWKWNMTNATSTSTMMNFMNSKTSVPFYAISPNWQYLVNNVNNQLRN